MPRRSIAGRRRQRPRHSHRTTRSSRKAEKPWKTSAASAVCRSMPPLSRRPRRRTSTDAPSSGTPLSVARPPTPTAAQPLPPALHRTSRSLTWVAIGVVVLVITAFLVRRALSPRETSTPIPTAAPTAKRAAEPPLPPPVTPAPIEQAQPPKVAPRGRQSASSPTRDRRCALSRGHQPGHCPTVPDLFDERRQLAMRSGRRLGGTGTDRPLHTCQIPARDRGRASLVSRKDTAAVREADDSCQHDGGISHVQPADC